MRIGVVGINHKLAELKLREQLAKVCHHRFHNEKSLHGEHHFILLSTCNRTEIYFNSDDLPATHTYLLSILRLEIGEDFDQKLYSYFGRDCFAHLIRVTSGLDSAVIAETEIQGQVKVAYETAQTRKNLPKELHFIFQKSLKISKKIRTEIQLGRGAPTMEQAIWTTGKYFLRSKGSASILFVGASEINCKILTYLQSKKMSNITLCNRTFKKAKQISTERNINLLEWDNLVRDWINFDWIILGTKSTDFLLTQEQIQLPFNDQKLIMDLCVPRNVDPLLAKDPRITLLNIDQTNRLLRIRNRNMNKNLTIAESMILESAYQHVQRYNKKQIVKLNDWTISA